MVAAGDMTLKQRDSLLVAMTDEVARLVLRDNYLQTQALSVLETDVSEDVSRELAMADAAKSDAGRALGSTLVAATKKTLRAATKRSAAKEDERRKAIPARVRGVAGNSNSSVVVCDLKTGVCCVGDQCFIG